MSPEVRSKIERRMRETGEDWWTASTFFARRGGRVSGLRRSSKAASLRRERSKQEAMHIR